MNKVRFLLLTLSLSWCLPAHAQSTGEETTPGLLTTSGCPGGASVCFKAYSLSNPLPISVVDLSNHSGYCYTSNGSSAAATFQACGGGGGSVSVTAGSANIVISPTPGTGTFTVNLGATPSITTSLTSPFINATTAGTGYEIGGANALSFNSADSGTAGSSLAIGVGALTGQTSSAAYKNTAMGYQALSSTMTTAAVQNTAVGYQAGSAVTSGTQNTFMGYQAGNFLNSGNQMVVIGAGAGSGSGSIGQDTIIGAAAQNDGFSNNTALGYNANAGRQNNSDDVSIGANTQAQGQAVVIGSGAGNNNGCCNGVPHSVVIGYQAGQKINANNNLAIGFQVAKNTLATGTGNILIGTSSTTDTPAAGSSNEINIGGLLFYNTVSLAAPVVTSCGTSPTIDAHANNRSGTVTVGTGTATSCTITFAGGGYTTWNHCRVTSQTTEAALAYSYTTTVLTITGTSLVSDLLDYDCDGY